MRVPGVILLGAALLCCAIVPPRFAAGAPPPIDPATACATDFAAIRVPNDPNTVIVRASDLAGPFQGTITAYGRTTSWTGVVGRYIVTERFGMQDASIAIHADEAIEGVEYAPPWASCTFHAGARDADGYDQPDRVVDRPLLQVSNPRPVDAPTCETPYRYASVVSASRPPQIGPTEPGLGRVAVAIDGTGKLRFTRVVSAPTPRNGIVTVQTALHSTFSGAIFRCKPVASGLEVAVGFMEP